MSLAIPNQVDPKDHKIDRRISLICKFKLQNLLFFVTICLFPFLLITSNAWSQTLTCSASSGTTSLFVSSDFNSISIGNGCTDVSTSNANGQSITANISASPPDFRFEASGSLIQNFKNFGQISGNGPGAAVDIFAATVINYLENSGSINSGQGSVGIKSDGGATIQEIYNADTGDISGLGSAIVADNDGTISKIRNAGNIQVSSSGSAVSNSNGGSIGSIQNSGYLGGNISINNRSSLGSVLNEGTIFGDTYGIYNNINGSISLIENNNRIEGRLREAIKNNQGSIHSIQNNGALWGGIDNDTGSIHQIFNRGVMNSVSNVSGNIGIINNTGSMSSSSPVSILNRMNSTISSINNYGTISSLAIGIDNDPSSHIGIINNFGSITGQGASGITNSGAIATINNYQGSFGSGSAPLTYSYNLPSNYNIIVNQNRYGQLQVTNARSPEPNNLSAKMTFGVYSGSTLAYLKQRYGSVLSSTDGSLDGKIANFSGSTSSGRKWRLIDNGDGTYDLEIDGYIVVSKVFSSLQSNRDALLGAMHERYAVLNAVSQYDCNRFDKYGLCISMQSRSTGWGSQTTGAGVLNIAYRPHPNVHAGVYLDYQVAQATPFGTNLGSGGIQYGYNNPTFGGYVGFSQSGYNGTPVNAGLQAFVSGGYNPGKVTVTRAMLEGTEPGQGTAGLNAYYAYGTLGYGFKVADKTTIAPYTGLFYTNVIRNAYQEQLNLLVQSPLGYNAFYEQLLTGVVGGRVQSMITDKLGANVGAGAQFDLTRNANSYSGYSYIEGMEAFGIEHAGSWNGARPTGQAGVFYNVTKNEQLLLNTYVGQQAYTTRTYTSLVAGYQVSF